MSNPAPQTLHTRVSGRPDLETVQLLVQTFGQGVDLIVTRI